jgi:alpha,alpha-trehalase
VKTRVSGFVLGLLLNGLVCSAAGAQTFAVPEHLWRLVEQEDTDGDRRITIHDRVTSFVLRDTNGIAALTVTNSYQLSVLLQGFKGAEEQHRSQIRLEEFQLNENPVDRVHRLIQDVYWDALTRRIDRKHLDKVVADSKVRSGADYIYVPAADEAAFRYFQPLEQNAIEQHRSPALRIVRLPPPEEITGEFVRQLDGRHGILTLKLEIDPQGRPIRGVPFVVPGGRFNELYYWDSYFIVLGLLADGRTDLARGTADNLVYELEHYGKIPNANRSYYLTRSQPPLLTSVLRTIYQAGAADRRWLAAGLKAAVEEYRHVWLGRERLVTIGEHRLSRYYDSGGGPCPEVEPGHYDVKIAPWLTLARTRAGDGPGPLTPYRFLGEYLFCSRHASLTVGGLSLEAFFKHDRALRESGHDTTHRFDDRTADFVPVDLNALLYKYERDIAEILDQEFGGRLPSLGADFAKADDWKKRASTRQRSMMTLMWDEARGFFFDYDFVRGRRSSYVSATGLFPLWAKLLDDEEPQDRQRVRRMAAFARENLEESAGLAATAKASVASAQRHDPRQWDHPYGWPPHQMLAWQGFRNYGLDAEAERLAYRWVYMIARNARDYNGTIPEKFNVLTGSHDVFVEYGNVGTKFAYIAPEGFGWMNASYQVGLKLLCAERRADLRNFKPPPPTR